MGCSGGGEILGEETLQSLQQERSRGALNIPEGLFLRDDRKEAALTLLHQALWAQRRLDISGSPKRK